jgi:hypothetical protein
MTAGKLLCYQGGAQRFSGNWFRRWGFDPQRTGRVTDIDG